MRLDRDENETGIGKYALVKLRDLHLQPSSFGTLQGTTMAALNENPSALDFGIEGSDSEFFVIRLKDKFAAPALHAYANAALRDDPYWAAAVQKLASKAEIHAGKKMPD